MNPRLFVLFAAFAFLLNFLWESWHCAYLYQKDAGIYLLNVQGPEDFVRLITHVSSVDAALLTGIVGVGTLIWRSQFWEKLSSAHVIFFVAAALIIAAGIEIHAVFIAHKWAYSDLMPTVFEIGISPLFQLPVTGLIALWLARGYRVGYAP